MASSSSLTLFLFFISVFTLLPLLEASNGGFSVELIHRDSPKSPFYDPNSTYFSYIGRAVEQSRARAFYLQDVVRKSRLSSYSVLADDEKVSSAVYPLFSDYLTKLKFGTPGQIIIVGIDTGSDLTWVRLTPCPNCMDNKAPIFDPHASSTYNIISCMNTDFCNALSTHSCDNNNDCQYSSTYGEGSSVTGLLSNDTIGFDSTDGQQGQFPATIFGCTQSGSGSIDLIGVGLLGLGGGKLSFIRQFGSRISSKFSYCLPSYNKFGGFLNFGSNAVVSESNAVTTSLIFDEENTQYFLNLDHISVAGKDITVLQSERTRGNIIIDSGTTLIYIDDSAALSLEDVLRNSVGLPIVLSPDLDFSFCFDVSDQAGSLAKFPDITFHFAGGASIVLPPSSVFMNIDQTNTVCLGIISSDDVQIDFHVLGNIAQQNFHIGYDLDAMKLTMAPNVCSAI